MQIQKSIQLAHDKIVIAEDAIIKIFKLNKDATPQVEETINNDPDSTDEDQLRSACPATNKGAGSDTEPEHSATEPIIQYDKAEKHPLSKKYYTTGNYTSSMSKASST